MNDDSTTLSGLKTLVTDFRDARDWKQFHNPKDLATAISIEAAELLELFLWKSTDEIEAMISDPSKMEKIQEELADVLIFSLSFSEVTGIDLSSAIRGKLAKNARKYPVDKARGSAKKYTDL